MDTALANAATRSRSSVGMGILRGVGLVKDQYFGDVNDYRKYGLLRALGHAGFQTLVVWMLILRPRVFLDT